MLNQVYKDVILIALACSILNLIVDVAPCSLNVYKLRNKHACLNNETVNRYYEKRKNWQTSNLGSILFKNQPMNYQKRDKIFTVFIWNHPHWSQSYIKTFLTSRMCNVKNCIFTSDDSSIDTVDVIIINLSKNKFPWGLKRNPSQIWVFQTNESPKRNFNKKNISKSIEAIANIFNWSMTYRSDSDVPTPYGLTVPLSMNVMERMSTSHITKIIPHWESKQRDVLVAAMISNCKVPERMNYLKELQKHIKIDIIGNCATSLYWRASCPLHKGDCPKINDYLFFLAFENSRCRQYITEKVFYNALSKGAIPVVMGAPLFDYERLLPPHSFLHVDSFNSPRDLAKEILNLSMNADSLELYHMWRKHFTIINEHGYFGDIPYELCRLCQALNYNDNQFQVYNLDTLKIFLDPKILCK